MSAVHSRPPGSSTGLRRTDERIVRLLCALLPAGCRARQGEEWAGDLVVLADEDPTVRWRYLFGAARTLPSLRNAFRHRDTARVEVPAGVRGSVARVLLLGLAWPILSWVLWVPVRYYAFGIPGRLEAGGPSGVIDPQSVWPFEGTPGWLWPLGAVFHLGAWVTVLGGPFLLAAVGVVGSLAAWLWRGRRRAHRAAVAVAALTCVVSVLVWTAVTDGATTHDDGYVAGLLGATAIVLGTSTGDLRRRTRAALVMLGVAAITVLVSFHTTSGVAMLGWFQD